MELWRIFLCLSITAVVPPSFGVSFQFPTNNSCVILDTEATINLTIHLENVQRSQIFTLEGAYVNELTSSCITDDAPSLLDLRMFLYDDKMSFSFKRSGDAVTMLVFYQIDPKAHFPEFNVSLGPVLTDSTHLHVGTTNTSYECKSAETIIFDKDLPKYYMTMTLKNTKLQAFNIEDGVFSPATICDKDIGSTTPSDTSEPTWKTLVTETTPKETTVTPEGAITWETIGTETTPEETTVTPEETTPWETIGTETTPEETTVTPEGTTPWETIGTETTPEETTVTPEGTTPWETIGTETTPEETTVTPEGTSPWETIGTETTPEETTVTPEGTTPWETIGTETTPEETTVTPEGTSPWETIGTETTPTETTPTETTPAETTPTETTPEHTTSPEPDTTTTSPVPHTNTYVVRQDGIVCVVLVAAIQLDIVYTNKSSVEETGKIAIPSAAMDTYNGTCGNMNDTLDIQFFDNWSLKLTIGKDTQTSQSVMYFADSTTVTYSWKTADLTYVLDREHFKDINNPSDKPQTVHQEMNNEEFRSSNTKTYQCISSTNIQLSKNVSIQLSNLQYRAFGADNNRNVIDGTQGVVECEADKSQETSDKKPTIAIVGATLGSLCLILAALYIISKYRYKKMRSPIDLDDGRKPVPVINRGETYPKTIQL